MQNKKDSILELGINEGVSNAAYHGDREYMSSSVLKLILKDIEAFHKKYILLNEDDHVQKNVFDEGSLVHAMILEPEVIDDEFAFYPGFHKRGNAFKQFKEDNPGMIYISESQKMRCEKYVAAYDRRAAAVALMEGGVPELSLCAELMGVKIKVRPDYINVNEGYIVDVKTSAYSVDKEVFKQTCEDFGYGLSASLYCEVAKKIYNKDFDFYFVAISKSEEVCEVYKTSEVTFNKGREKVYAAIAKYKKCKATNNWTNEYKRASIRAENDNYEIEEI